MNLLGIHLKLMIGGRSTVPPPAPPKLSEALQSVKVSYSDQGRSGFQLSFRIGRGLRDMLDYSLVTERLLKPINNRVIVLVYFNVTRHVLLDGIITNHQLSPSNDPGAATLTVTGEDVSLLMDLEERSRPHRQSDAEIVRSILSEYGLQPTLGQISERANTTPAIQEPQRQQSNRSDRRYIESLANFYGYLFYVKPGQTPGTNEAYWGPPNRSGRPQKALSVNMGPLTNVESVNFQFDALGPTQVSLLQYGQQQPPIAQRSPATQGRPLASEPATAYRTAVFEDTGLYDQLASETGARDLAQARFDASLNDPITGSGELDVLRYGGILEMGKLVDLRGAGRSYDGTYYVKSVSHRIDIRKGSYKQSFTLTREGFGATSMRVSV
jgi:phage protein D